MKFYSIEELDGVFVRNEQLDLDILDKRSEDQSPERGRGEQILAVGWSACELQQTSLGNKLHDLHMVFGYSMIVKFLDPTHLLRIITVSNCFYIANQNSSDFLRKKEVATQLKHDKKKSPLSQDQEVFMQEP